MSDYIEAHENVAIESVEQAFAAMAEWHGQIVDVVAQEAAFPMDQVNPIVTKTRINEETGEPEDYQVPLTTVEEKEAFKAGMREALAHFAQLPFFEVEEAEPTK